MSDDRINEGQGQSEEQQPAPEVLEALAWLQSDMLERDAEIAALAAYWKGQVVSICRRVVQTMEALQRIETCPVIGPQAPPAATQRVMQQVGLLLTWAQLYALGAADAAGLPPPPGGTAPAEPPLPPNFPGNAWPT